MKTQQLRSSLIILPLATALANLSGCAIESTRKPQHYTCIPTKLFRCEPDEQSCMTIPIIRALGDVKISINLAERKVKSYSDEDILSFSDIDLVQEEGDLIYLHGKGRGIDNTYRSWNAVIDLNNGQLYSSSITTGAGHITYGECHADN